MANPEHVAVAKKGIDFWNEWRDEHPTIVPDLSGAELPSLDLGGYDHMVNHEDTSVQADLNGVDFRGANLADSNLAAARLESAVLNGANLSGAYLFSFGIVHGLLGSCASCASSKLGGGGVWWCTGFEVLLIWVRCSLS